MFDLTNVILIAAIAFIAGLFWQLRQLGEQAQRVAKNYCKQQQLQFLDVALLNVRLKFNRRGPYWNSRYQFGFSSDQENRYEGVLEFNNRRLAQVHMPVYRTFEQPDPYREPYH